MSAPQISLLNQGKVKDWRKIASDTANALNNDVVHNTDDEIISGTKTFTSTIIGTADRAAKDDDGNVISETYLKAALTPSLTVVDEEPTSQSTQSLAANSLIIWTTE